MKNHPKVTVSCAKVIPRLKSHQTHIGVENLLYSATHGRCLTAPRDKRWSDVFSGDVPKRFLLSFDTTFAEHFALDSELFYGLTNLTEGYRGEHIEGTKEHDMGFQRLERGAERYPSKTHVLDRYARMHTSNTVPLGSG